MGPESSIYRALSVFADVVIINVLTLVGCLPIVTAGASLTAASRVTNEVVRDTDSYIAGSWWHAFRGNLRQSLAWWVPSVILIAGAWAQNWALGGTTDATLAGALTSLVLVAVVLILALLVWILPLSAFFTNTVTGHLGNAAILAVRHAGRTLLCVAATSAPILVFVLLPGARTATMWFMVLVGLSFLNYLNALIQKPVLDGLLEAATGTGQ
ncbi:MAG: DUF624 domain-containing protein [Ancrocorticia sp.]|uniref:DUF624 domain-containing protein n=1 Tax=Ancrocorticia sp. TaxID=2593684 RepID=UPI003F92CACE